MSMRTGNPGGGGSTPLSNPVLIGTTIVVALMVGVFLSYNANKGLPFVQTFALNAEVPDAQQLVAGSEVRIGGFRVGQVNEIVAVPAEGDDPPFARLEMKLDGSLTGIPADTKVQVRPRSLLGAKFVELQPGRGEDVKAGATLPLDNAKTTPELDEIFNTFDADTRAGLQGTIRNLGDSVAARGPDINRSIESIATLLPPLQRTAELLADDRTDFDGFVEAVAQFGDAVAPVAGDLVSLFDRGAATLAAIDAAGDGIGRFIAELPETEAVGQEALTNISPVLRDLADLTGGLRAGTRELPTTTAELAGALRSGTRVLRRTPVLTEPLDTALVTLRVVSDDPAAPGSLKKLTTALRLLSPSVSILYEGQVGCNVLSVNLRNQGDAVSRGDQQGTWLSFVPIISTAQGLRSGRPSEGLHFNPYPRLDREECEAGNEPYVHGTQIGNPETVEPSGPLDETAPPEGVTARARSAGLLDSIEGASR